MDADPKPWPQGVKNEEELESQPNAGNKVDDNQMADRNTFQMYQLHSNLGFSATFILFQIQILKVCILGCKMSSIAAPERYYADPTFLFDPDHNFCVEQIGLNTKN